MKRTTINVGHIKTISWLNDTIVDWASGGNQYMMDGSTRQASLYYAFNFDGSINTADGKYAFIYQKPGTKGLLLKNGELLREINRSYYCASAYEYPAAFTTIDDVTYLIHCPKEYCKLDFENVETGEIVTDIAGRAPSDIFHSRLELSPDGFVLMSKGWHWHPIDVVYFYNIKGCLIDPFILDKDTSLLDIGAEVATASFISETKVLIGSGEEVFDEENIIFHPNHIAVWNMVTGLASTPVKVSSEIGTLFAINEELTWDTYLYPKIININTGDIVDKDESVYSGKQKSSIVTKDDLVQIVFNRNTKQLAIVGKEVIEVFTP